MTSGYAANAGYCKEPALGELVDALIAGSGRSIETAENLPAAAYTSQNFFNLEVEKVFKTDWICVGHLSQIPNVGDYYTVDLFDDLLVVVRGHDRVRVLSRVCLHRWASIVEGTGNVDQFTCPFHAWTYNLDGGLKASPFMQNAREFDSRSCRLPEMRTEIVAELGLIFVTSSPTVEPIAPRMAGLIDTLKPYRLAEAVGVRPFIQDMDYNWKIYIETGQECYHHFAAHKETLEPIFPTRLSWCEQDDPAWSVCFSPLKPEVPQTRAGVGLPNFRGVSEQTLRTIIFYHIFPLTRLFLRPDRVVLRCVFPDGPLKTRATSLSLVAPEVAEQPELIAEKFALDSRHYAQQKEEDNAISAMQQRGAMSSFAQPGRLSHLEATVWHLGEYLRRKLCASA